MNDSAPDNEVNEWWPKPKARKGWKRRLLRWLLLLGGAYLGVFLVLIFIERRMVYHPAKATEDWQPAPAEIHAQDVELPLDKKVTIHAWWCAPEGWTPDKGALLYCHGNAGNLSHRGWRAKAWQEQMGVAVMLFDYPGYGRSTGKPTEKGCYDAAEEAWHWIVDQQQVKPENLMILGGSLGGGIAVEMGTRHPFRAMILLNTFTSIPDVAAKMLPWIPSRPFIKNRYENQKKIPHCNGPVFISHGTADSMIPFNMGQRLLDAANEPKAFYPREGDDHHDPVREDFFEELKRFLKTVEGQ